jgi:hypothetical protein
MSVRFGTQSFGARELARGGIGAVRRAA